VVVGGVEIEPLTDAVGVLGELAELYPDMPAEAREPYRRLYPQLFSGAQWRLPCTCYLIRTATRTILVDTGVGPAGLWDWGAEREGGLLPALAERGVGPADVDIVFVTHVHIDHVGWNTDAAGEPVFTRARFVLHREAVGAAHHRSERAHIRRCVLPLLERELVDPLVGETEIAAGVLAFPLPGHDPGHMGLRLGADAVLIADAAVHPALLAEPERLYESDDDHGQAAATRRELVEELAGGGAVVVCGHYPGSGIGRLSMRDGRVVWKEAA
jgi:glyoxylase-like metal-dependent hydrolase (beta-lactamase superfamily II)